MHISREQLTPATRTQARGRKRRALLIQAAKDLLDQRSIRVISMADIAALAGIPISSAYHFFPDTDALWLGVVRDFEAELHEWQSELSLEEAQTWQEIVARYVRHGAAFFGQNAAATKLMLGPFSPPVIKLKDRDSDYAISLLLIEKISEIFILNNFDDLEHAFFHAVEIADLFFSLSIIKHEKIMPYYAVEATRAVLAYLEIYIPKVLIRLSD